MAHPPLGASKPGTPALAQPGHALPALHALASSWLFSPSSARETPWLSHLLATLQISFLLSSVCRWLLPGLPWWPSG